jgi:hypothetical protein
MSDPSITYFPVGNGDTSKIRLSDGTTVLIDCNITSDSRDGSVKTRYDVHAHLLRELRKDGKGIPHADAFILTHPDNDHCCGFKDTFYTGDPAKYGDSHKKQGLILIDELWFSPRIFAPHEELGDSAKAFLKEAKRRRELYRANKPERKNAGNRLRIIGSTDSEDNQGLDDIVTVPGNTISLINGEVKKDFSFFVHGPFKEDVDSEDDDRNKTSVVLQARFDVDGEKHAALAFFGGDADHLIWENILKRSKDEDLRWDLFLAPHHCSWSFFNETPYEDNKTPKKSSLDILAKKREGAIVVASCKPVRKDDDNPPSYAAAQQYKRAVGDGNFYVTSEHPDEEEPKPLVFEMSKNGPVKGEISKTASSLSSSAARDYVAGTPQTYGGE